jgi:hypothetical protein
MYGHCLRSNKTYDKENEIKLGETCLIESCFLRNLDLYTVLRACYCYMAILKHVKFHFSLQIGPQKRTVHKEMWWPKHLVFVGYIFSCDTIVFMSRHNFLVPLSVFSVFFRWLCVSVLIKTDPLFLFVILWIVHDKHKQKREEIKWIESFKLKCV